MTDRTDILLTQKFIPEMGGSIRWMYEVYRAWPWPVQVITHDVYRHPPNTPEFAVVPKPPNGVDHVTGANLTMDRRDIFMDDWGMENPKRVLRYWRMMHAVWQRLGGGRKVRVHCTHAVPEVVSLIPLKWRFGDALQIVCYAHGEEVTACLTSRQLRLLMGRAHRVIDLMIANSRYTQNVLDGLIDADKVHVVHPGVSLSEFAGASEAGEAWRREHNCNSKVIALTVGRLDLRKNHAAVIRALGELRDEIPNLEYHVAGEGRERARLERLARDCNVADRVVFAGPVDGPTRLAMYGGCDLFVMPAIRDGSDVEGFGMVMIEAGACGKACIGGREGGQPEALIDGETGLVVNGRDQNAVTSAFRRLAADNDLRHALGTRAATRAAQYDWRHVVQQTVKLVEKMH
jgi:phosphatidylinositol alpha-1,6-mannosyltransferase